MGDIFLLELPDAALLVGILAMGLLLGWLAWLVAHTDETRGKQRLEAWMRILDSCETGKDPASERHIFLVSEDGRAAIRPPAGRDWKGTIWPVGLIIFGLGLGMLISGLLREDPLIRFGVTLMGLGLGALCAARLPRTILAGVSEQTDLPDDDGSGEAPTRRPLAAGTAEKQFALTSAIKDTEQAVPPATPG